VADDPHLRLERDDGRDRNGDIALRRRCDRRPNVGTATEAIVSFDNRRDVNAATKVVGRALLEYAYSGSDEFGPLSFPTGSVVRRRWTSLVGKYED
jgi:hypothetical protein